jgi:hypothetical protein
MENKKLNGNIIPGVILIAIGILFFLKEFHYVEFNWTELLRLWPLALVIIGVNMLLGGRSNANIVLLIGVFVAVPLLFLRSCADKVKDKTNYNFNWSDKDPDDTSSSEADTANGFKMNLSSSTQEDMEKGLTNGELKLDAGLLGIELLGQSAPAYLYETSETNTLQSLKVKKTIKDSKVYLEIDSGQKDSSQKKKNGEVTIKLNNSIPWDMDIDLGLAGAKLDLKDFDIQNIKLDVGMAGTEIIMGDKAKITNMSIDAGMAGIELKVPEKVGIRVKSDSFLSGTDFEGFTKDGDYYYSQNYKTSTSKLEIKLSSAFSGFEIKRY